MITAVPFVVSSQLLVFLVFIFHFLVFLLSRRCASFGCRVDLYSAYSYSYSNSSVLISTGVLFLFDRQREESRHERHYAQQAKGNGHDEIGHRGILLWIWFELLELCSLFLFRRALFLFLLFQ
jgi:hypothetical protein